MYVHVEENAPSTKCKCKMYVKLLTENIFHSVVLSKNKDCLKQNLMSQCSAMQKNSDIFEDVVRTLRSTLMTQQFFCDKVTPNMASLHRVVKTADCEPKFYTDVETGCAEPFRKIYTKATEKKSAEVCT